jgi:hypothetical protein
MRRGVVLGLLIAIGGLSLMAAGAQAPRQRPGGLPEILESPPTTIEIQKLKDNLY